MLTADPNTIVVINVIPSPQLGASYVYIPGYALTGYFDTATADKIIWNFNGVRGCWGVCVGTVHR